MKPWPDAIAELYPPAPDRYPTRPWWTYDATRTYLTRRGVRMPISVAHVEAIEHYHDAQNPLPHPGFRVGQVWAAVNGAGRVEAFAITQEYADPTGRLLRIAGSFSHVSRLQWLSGAFLVADPCCPWLAPWAPVEVKPCST